MLAAYTAPTKKCLEALVRIEEENLEVRYQLCALKLIDDDYDGAMSLLLEIMRKDSEFRNGVGRNGLLALFNLLGNKDELVDRYRKLMGSICTSWNISLNINIATYIFTTGLHSLSFLCL
jgi:putative thioredoxin